jgi:hypothetical protein
MPPSFSVCYGVPSINGICPGRSWCRNVCGTIPFKIATWRVWNRKSPLNAAENRYFAAPQPWYMGFARPLHRLNVLTHNIMILRRMEVFYGAVLPRIFFRNGNVDVHRR